jgi:large subunit ribosomal protein L15
VYFPVPLEALEAVFPAGAEITLAALAEKNVIPTRAGKPAHAKILGEGALSKKFSLKGIKASASAKAAIEKAGGTIVPIVPANTK